MARFKSRKRGNRSRKTYGGGFNEFVELLKKRMEIVPGYAALSADAAKKAEADARAVDAKMKVIEEADMEVNRIQQDIDRLNKDTTRLQADKTLKTELSKKIKADADRLKTAATEAEAKATRVTADHGDAVQLFEAATAAAATAVADVVRIEGEKQDLDEQLRRLRQTFDEKSVQLAAITAATAGAAAKASAAEQKKSAVEQEKIKAESDKQMADSVFSAKSEAASVATAAAQKAEEAAAASKTKLDAESAKKAEADRKKTNAEQERDRAIGEAKRLLANANAAADKVKISAANAAATSLASQMNNSFTKGVASQRHNASRAELNAIIGNVPAGATLESAVANQAKRSVEQQQLAVNTEQIFKEIRSNGHNKKTTILKELQTLYGLKKSISETEWGNILQTRDSTNLYNFMMGLVKNQAAAPAAASAVTGGRRKHRKTRRIHKRTHRNLRK